MHPENVEEQFSPQESFAVIQSMINTAKNQFSQNGHLYLLWGWIVFAWSVGQFLLQTVFHSAYHFMIWSLTWLAFIYQIFYLVKEKRRERVRTYADTLIGFVWIVFVVLMFLFAFLLSHQLGNNYYIIMAPSFLALYGMPTFLSGIILRFRPLIIGAASCWALSIVSIYTPTEYQLLLLATAMIVAWIVPGYLLRNKYKKQNN
jgi:hypothetical protein